MKDYVRGCLLHPRANETLFIVDGTTGEITVTLDRYAIIPREVFEVYRQTLEMQMDQVPRQEKSVDCPSE